MGINHHPPDLRRTIKNLTKRIPSPTDLFEIGDWFLFQDESGDLIVQNQLTQWRVVLAAYQIEPEVGDSEPPEPEILEPETAPTDPGQV